jgi:type IV pilus biogenesis protein PilP
MIKNRILQSLIMCAVCTNLYAQGLSTASSNVADLNAASNTETANSDLQQQKSVDSSVASSKIKAKKSSKKHKKHASSKVVPPQAQQSLPVPPTLPNQPALGTLVPIPDQNDVSYEVQVSPLIKEIANKKANLEVKKIDLDAIKTDVDIAKARQELARANAGITSSDNNGKVIDVQNLKNSPLSLQDETAEKMRQMQAQIALSNSIKVIMINGYDDNLFAKIRFGNQGGYVVKKGDILPNGKEVLGVYQDYIEIRTPVQNKKAVSGDVERVFVTADVSQNSAGNAAKTTAPSSTGKDGSTSLAPFVVGPLSMPSLPPIGVPDANIVPSSTATFTSPK